LFLALAVSAGFLVAADELPKGDTILDKYVEVTGGKAAYAKVHNDMSTGTMEFTAMGMKGKLTSFGSAPNKRYVEIELEGVGKIQEVTNGDMAWSLSAVQGPRIKEGDEKAEALEQAKYNADASWRDTYSSAETMGVETVAGKECYKVVLKRKVGSPVTRWFDKETGLMVRMAQTAKTPMGDIESVSTVSDYRKEGDLLMAHKVDIQAGPMAMLITIDNVKQNVEIPKDKFDAPDEIKALMKKPEAK
jgi:hypothetical protein